MPSTVKDTAKDTAKDTDAAPAEEPTPAEATAAEATNTDIKLTFRTLDYVIPQKRLRSPHYRMAIAAADVVSMVYTLLLDVDARRWLLTVSMDEDADEVAVEFLRAVNAAAGLGNS